MRLFSNIIARVLPTQISTAVQSCENPQCRRAVRTSGILGRSRRSIALNGRWFCSTGCCLPELRNLVRGPMQGESTPTQHRHRVPLGLLLLSRQQITSDQLQQALALQRTDVGKMIGECLVQLGATSEYQVAAAVAAQWGCGVFSSSLPAHPPVNLPGEFLRHYRMMPVHWNERERILHIGFLNRVDYIALAAVESLLECRAEVCIIPGSQYRRALAGLAEQREEGQASFGRGVGEREISDIVFSYAEQIGADQIRVATTNALMWVRMLAASPVDLTFRLA